MFSIFGCPVKIHCNPETVKIDVRDAESNEVEKIQLFEYLSSKCPSLVGENARYYPTPWIGNGHAQTWYAAKFVETPDGGQIAVDWTPPMSQKPIDDTPTVVVLHGLTGGSHESYIRCLLEVLTNPPHNYRAVVINFRGCSESHITSPKLYSAASTNDLRTVLRYVQETIPDSSLIAVGFSMGANILVKYLGEEGDKTPLIAAASVGNPFDILGGSKYLTATYIGKYVYSPAMANNLKRCLKRHVDVMKQDTKIDLDHIFSAISLRDFDSRLTAVSFGYETVDHYYRDASSSQYITKVRIPLLCLNAEDDPICSMDWVPLDEIKYNPYCILATTYYGGHLGWFTGFLNPTRWCVKPLSEYCIAILEAKHPTKKSKSEEPLSVDEEKMAKKIQ